MYQEEKMTIQNKGHIKRAYYYGNVLYHLNVVSDRFLGRDLTRYKKKVMTAEEGNNALYDLVASDMPFAVARYGGTEARTIADVLMTQAGGKIGGLRDITLKRIVDLSGFFPKDDKSLLYDFAKMYYADEVAKEARLAELRMMEPYLFEKPWSGALKGKKVVVVHPFSETIDRQYLKRKQLFANEDTLPGFELRTVKAVQTLAGVEDKRFKTWFEALDYMFDKVMSVDFDIALIGCGAYGLPLAARVKSAGKQAVHMGGCLQILFGIKGKRWDDHRLIGKLYNDAWVRPGEGDKIDNSEVVENSCYW